MNQILKITTPIPTSVNNYRSSFNQGGKIKSAKTESTKDFECIMRMALRKEMDKINWETINPPNFADIHMKVFFKSKRSDLNNILKIPFDVMTEMRVYEDDKIAIPIFDSFMIDRKNPRVEWEISTSSKTGIFSSEEIHKEFIEKNCIGCIFNQERCKLYKDVINNVIPTGIDYDNNLCIICKRR